MSVEGVVASVIGVLICILLPPLYDGIHRKIRATIHSRIGPPILQTWYDIIKLFHKQDLVPEAASPLFSIAPYVAVAYVALAALMTPLVFNKTFLSFTWDIILFLYFLSSATIFLALGGLSSGNVFAVEGGRRELTLTLLLELTMAISIVSICVRASNVSITGIYAADRALYPSASIIISSIVLLICGYIEGYRLPFELPEAEPEIAGGLLIEYSGKRLALCKIAILAKQFLIVALALNFIEPWCILSLPLGTLSIILKTLLIFTIFALTEPLFGRYRIDMALKFVGILCFFAIIALMMSVVGV